MADFDEFFEAAKVDSKSSSIEDSVGNDGLPNPNFMTPMGSKSLDPVENEKIIDEIREWVKRYLVNTKVAPPISLQIFVSQVYIER